MASLSQGRKAAAQCGLFTHKSVPVIFEPPCILECDVGYSGNSLRIFRDILSVPSSMVKGSFIFYP